MAKKSSPLNSLKAKTNPIVTKMPMGITIRIKEANCGDQVCVRRGWAKENGETIVCLPHKLVIEVQGSQGGDSDDLIY